MAKTSLFSAGVVGLIPVGGVKIPQSDSEACRSLLVSHGLQEIGNHTQPSDHSIVIVC